MKPARRPWFAAVLLAACSTEDVVERPTPGLERMQRQRRADAFEASSVFADGRVLQAPPEGTVPTSRVLDPERGLGLAGQEPTRRVPLPLTFGLLERGRDRFDVFCAPCHGVLGDGQSVVGKNLPLVAPRSLVTAEIRAYPPGRLFRVVSEGFGLMPSYAAQLAVDDRWAVVAYVRALQLSQGLLLGRLPEAMQREAREALP